MNTSYNEHFLDSHVGIHYREVLMYMYDPNEAFGKDVDDDDDDKENRIAKDTALANEEDIQLMLKISGKQIKLFQLSKKKISVFTCLL